MAPLPEVDSHRAEAEELPPAEVDNQLGGRVRDGLRKAALTQAGVGSGRCLDSMHYHSVAQGEAKEHMARDYRTLRKGHGHNILHSCQ